MEEPKKVINENFCSLLMKVMDKIFITTQNKNTIKMPLSKFSFLNRKAMNIDTNTTTKRILLSTNMDPPAVNRIKMVRSRKSLLKIFSLLICN